MEDRRVYDPERVTRRTVHLDTAYSHRELEQWAATSRNPLRTRNPPAVLAQLLDVRQHATSADSAASLKRARDAAEDQAARADRADKIRKHYNSRKEQGHRQRDQSSIVGLRNYNNWIKAVLIAKFSRHAVVRNVASVRVLDLCCGKGGDLTKWQKSDFTLYVGIDIAEESVRQAHGRWQKRRDRTPTQVTQFYVLDCFGKSLDTIADGYFLQRNSFSHVSTQMALHYSFETPQKANMFFENVSNYLADGGYFVGTTLDAETLLGRLAEEQAERGPDVLEFGNAVYRVEFSSQDSPPDRFGHEYKFTLVDAVDAVPEYVVYWDLLVELASKHGLQLEYYKKFQDILAEEGEEGEFKELLQRMNVTDADNETDISPEEFEATELYVAFAFRKTVLPKGEQ